MGPLGWPEMIFIFLLAMLLFGPKKLPEIGRTVGRALTQFREASNELKSTVDQHLKSLEQEVKVEPWRSSLEQYMASTHASPSDFHYQNSYGSGTPHSAAGAPSLATAPVPEIAEMHSVPAQWTAANETAAL